MRSKATWMPAKSAGISLPASQRHLWFVVLFGASVAWFWGPLSTVVSLSLQMGARQYGPYEHYSHIVLVPLITLYLVWTNRRVIFATAADPSCPLPSAPLLSFPSMGKKEGGGETLEPRVRESVLGGLLVASGLALSGGVHVFGGDSLNALSAAMLACVITWWGAFVLCYGAQAFRKASFAFLLLLFMVPLPPVVLTAVIGLLQRASAEATDVLFGFSSVPVFRDGFLFVLPNVAVEVAEECSGIRSSLALFITGLVAGHLFLRSMWAKAALVFIVVPLTILKNAVRIVVLSLLASYVDPTFLTDSAIHRNGGIPLFFVTLLVLAGIVWLLQRSEAMLGCREESKG